MKRAAIFITKYATQKQIKGDYWYSYLEEKDKRVLRVYKQDKLVDEREANIGDAFELIIKGDNPVNVFVTPMTPPRKNWEVIAWLLGYSKHERTSSYEVYKNLLEKKREECERPGYVEAILEGPHFEFTEYSHVGDEKPEYRNLACWIDETIDRKEIIHLIPEFIYPEPFVRRVLKERFEVTDEEFDDALSAFC